MRVIALMATLLLLVPLVACGDDDDGPPDEWDTIASDVHQYTIDMPVGWTATTGDDDDTYAPPDDEDTSVLVEFGPMPGDLEGDYEGFVDSVEEAAVGHNAGVSNFVAEGRQTFAEHEGLVVEWTQLGQSDGRAYVRQAWIPNGDSSWYVTMTTSDDSKGDYDDTFQRMLDSFTPSD